MPAPQSLASKVVAVTGASAGIGLAVAEECAKAGAAVVVAARRTSRLNALAARIRSEGGRALAVEADVTREDDMDRLVAAATDTFGRLDVMVCNAGIGYHGTLDETPPAVMRRLVDVNLMGTFYAARAALIEFRRKKSGHIIAVSSIAGRRGIGGSSIYGATKAAQIAFIESLRAEFLGSRLHASIVYPVATTTEFHDAIERDYGFTAGGRGPRQSAETVAKAIVHCIVRPQAEVYPFARAWWLAALGVVAPAKTDRVVQRFGRHRHTSASRE